MVVKKTRQVAVTTLALLVGLGGAPSLSYAAPQAPERPSRANVLIGFTQPPGRDEQALVRGYGGTIKYTYHLVPAIAANIPEQAIPGLLRNPRVTNVDLDGTVQAVDAELDNSWGVKRIGSGEVHEGGNRGTGVTIAIIDSGVDYNHPDLNDNFDPLNRGEDYVQDDNDPMDVYGHGTHVAGTACAEDNVFGVVGVASECRLYSLRVLDDGGGGYWSDIIAALQWTVTSKIQVANLSLGSSQNPGGTVELAFANAEAAGVLIVAAAGNAGNPAGRGGNVIYPAKYSSVIAVAATDSNDRRASFSSTGSEVELAAPGVSVLSTWNDSTSYANPQPICVDSVCYYKYGSGTSMASPHVAGVGALVMAAGIADTNGNGRVNDEVRGVLSSTAEDLGAAGWDPRFGFGLVSAVAAVGLPTPPGTGTISGTVVDADTLEPIEGAAVTDGTRSTATGADGAYTLADVPEGIYTVTASAAGYQEVSQGVVVSADTTSLADFSLSVIPEPEPATTMSVSSINYATGGGRSGDKHLLITVALADDLGNPVGGASLSMDLKLDGAPFTSYTGLTGTEGTVTFKLANAPSGFYASIVTSVTAEGLIWDGLTPNNFFNKQ